MYCFGQAGQRLPDYYPVGGRKCLGFLQGPFVSESYTPATTDKTQASGASMLNQKLKKQAVFLF